MTSLVTMLLHGVTPELPTGVKKTFRSFDEVAVRKPKKGGEQSNLNLAKDLVFEAIASGIETRNLLEEETKLARTTIDRALDELLVEDKINVVQVNTAKFFAVTGKKPTCATDRGKRRKAEVLSIIRASKQTSMTALMVATGLSETGLRTWLRELDSEGLIRKFKDGRNMYWSPLGVA